MKKDELIPSLIIEDRDSLPKRGGKYVSQEEKTQKAIKAMEKKMANCNCNCDCNCDCDCHDCNC